MEASVRVEAGRLVRLLADWTPAFSGFHLYHPSARQMPKQLRAFTEFLSDRLEAASKAVE
jgi:DNA-binding transcriptional LysR family regulator